jgi:hypothetical protein
VDGFYLIHLILQFVKCKLGVCLICLQPTPFFFQLENVEGIINKGLAIGEVFAIADMSVGIKVCITYLLLQI